MKWKRIAILIPSVLGILANIFLTLGVFENPVFFFKKEPSVYFRVDLGTLFLFIGLSLTILLGAGAALADWSQRIENQGQARAAAERRRFLRRLDHELKKPTYRHSGWSRKSCRSPIAGNPPGCLRKCGNSSLTPQPVIHRFT